jgi:hypothetical protein
MELTSPAYSNGTTMPARFAAADVAGGAGVSVPLAWAVPPAACSLVVALIDIHPVAHGWVHWLVTDIPAEATSLPEGSSLSPAMPLGALEHPNSAGRPGYGGPRPPVGSGVHDYVAHLYALDVAHLDVSADSAWDKVSAAMSGHVLDTTTLVGRFGR